MNNFIINILILLYEAKLIPYQKHHSQSSNQQTYQRKIETSWRQIGISWGKIIRVEVNPRYKLIQLAHLHVEKFDLNKYIE
jgi:hypothetical protein